jgi:hypothetical protein
VKKGHLTLVDSAAAPPPPAPRRLSTNRQGQFLPATVIDLRQTLRFDQPGSSRSVFFDQLSRIRSTYMRAPVEWSDLKIRHLAADQRLPARVFHETVERWEGHIALLVSKVEQARYLETILNLALSEHHPDGWDILQVS